MRLFELSQYCTQPPSRRTNQEQRRMDEIAEFKRVNRELEDVVAKVGSWVQRTRGGEAIDPNLGAELSAAMSAESTVLRQVAAAFGVPLPA